MKSFSKIWLAGLKGLFFALFVCFSPAAARAAIGPPPLITVQPLDQTVLKGNNAIFSVIAVSGTTMTYQWKQNGTVISGATQSAYTVKAQNNTSFSVDIVNASGMVSSSNANLIVIKRPDGKSDTYSVFQDHSFFVAAPGVLANDSDPNGLWLTAVLGTLPSHGTLTLNLDGSFGYTPAAGFYGTDSFTYRATDTLLGSDPTTVTIHVIQTIDAPLTLTTLGMATNGFRLQLNGPAPANYVIFSSSDLQNWTPISTNAVSSGLLQFTDTSATASPNLFYKAIAQKSW